jgi:hypothetical protein
MKRLLMALVAIIGLSVCGFAQTAAPAKEKPKVAVTAKHTQKKSTKAETQQSPVTTSTTPTTTTTPVTTKGMVKKNGTPDMRYKANKAAAKTQTTTTTHLKKNGTPDKRYKENKKG